MPIGQVNNYLCLKEVWADISEVWQWDAVSCFPSRETRVTFVIKTFPFEWEFAGNKFLGCFGEQIPTLPCWHEASDSRVQGPESPFPILDSARQWLSWLYSLGTETPARHPAGRARGLVFLPIHSREYGQGLGITRLSLQGSLIPLTNGGFRNPLSNERKPSQYHQGGSQRAPR